MKKLTSLLLSVCMLMTICSFTGCGEEKWVFYEDFGIYVDNYFCDDIVSDNRLKNIEKMLETKFKDTKLIVTEESVKGLLEKDISFETVEIIDSQDCYVTESIRTEELDSIFEVLGHIVILFDNRIKIWYNKKYE